MSAPSPGWLAMIGASGWAAALQASLTRQLDPMPAEARPRLRNAARRLLNKRGRRAA